ncbi:MAG: hypothetical protein J0M02_14750 [Planctomycetes bacterium]|nr:hypothetical protein [Planctomycetota bacterium]
MLKAAILIALASSACAADAVAFAEVPAGQFQRRVAELRPEARERVLKTLGRHRGLLRDLHRLHVSPLGGLAYVNCGTAKAATAVSTAVAAAAVAPVIAAAPVALTGLPIYHSRPGASCTVVLDFTGATVTGTQWNVSVPSRGYIAQPSYSARPFDLDDDETTFSDLEVEVIRLICERVAEDLRPFDVDVTTVEGVYSPLVGHVVITASLDANGNECPYGSAGGVAYIDCFGEIDYHTASSPAWVYYDNLASASLRSGNPAVYAATLQVNVAEAAAHEFGHNLGLKHDGQFGDTDDYYAGHGSPLSWAPIMGASYGKMVTQWSKGEYYRARVYSQGVIYPAEDDLSIIASKLSRVSDDFGDTVDAASVPALVDVGATRTLAVDGTISSAADADLFRFSADAGMVSFSAEPVAVTSGMLSVTTPGSNLDIRLDVLDEAGAVVPGLEDDAADQMNASISGTLPQAGVYHLRVRGAGNREPLYTGYSTYGSIGAYTLSGTVPAAIPGTVSFTAASVSQAEGDADSTLLLTVRRSYDATGPLSVTFASANGTAASGADYDAVAGTLTWASGNVDDQSISVTIHGDSVDEAARTFTVALSAPSDGNVLGLAPTVTVTLSNDDAAAGGGDGGDDGDGGGGGGGGGCGAGTAAGLLLAGLALLPLLLRRRR